MHERAKNNSLLDVGSVHEGQIYRLGHVGGGEHQDVVPLAEVVDLIGREKAKPEYRTSDRRRQPKGRGKASARLRVGGGHEGEGREGKGATQGRDGRSASACSSVGA